MRALAISLFWICVACVPMSCDSEPRLYTVEGKLLVHGEPAQGAMVVFHREGDKNLNSPKPSGEVGTDGTFKLETSGRMGAPAGKYVVVVYWEQKAPKAALKSGMGSDEERTIGKNRMTGTPYADAATSPWKVTVEKALVLEPYKID